MEFRKWLESVDHNIQKDRASFATIRPNVKDTQLSRYGFMKKCKHFKKS